VRALLAGERVSVEGRYVRLDGVGLDHPPAEPPPVFTGVRRAKSLALSGRVADGTILAEPSPLPYIAWAREQIAATRPHRLTVLALCAMDEDVSAARDALRPIVEERAQEGGPQFDGLDATGDDLIDQVAVLGPPDRCAETIAALAEAGADAVVLVPPPGLEVDVAALGRELRR
jgi:5,10-methylenetetrahydromethanopterin reductase